MRWRTSNCSLLLIYRPRKDERMSWPSWLTCSGRLTHISGHPLAAGQAQNSESSPAKDRRSTTVLRNQPAESITVNTHPCRCIHLRCNLHYRYIGDLDVARYTLHLDCSRRYCRHMLLSLYTFLTFLSLNINH